MRQCTAGAAGAIGDHVIGLNPCQFDRTVSIERGGDASGGVGTAGREHMLRARQQRLARLGERVDLDPVDPDGRIAIGDAHAVEEGCPAFHCRGECRQLDRRLAVALRLDDGERRAVRVEHAGELDVGLQVRLVLVEVGDREARLGPGDEREIQALARIDHLVRVPERGAAATLAGVDGAAGRDADVVGCADRVGAGLVGCIVGGDDDRGLAGRRRAVAEGQEEVLPRRRAFQRELAAAAHGDVERIRQHPRVIVGGEGAAGSAVLQRFVLDQPHLGAVRVDIRRHRDPAAVRGLEIGREDDGAARVGRTVGVGLAAEDDVVLVHVLQVSPAVAVQADLAALRGQEEVAGASSELCVLARQGSTRRVREGEVNDVAAQAGQQRRSGGVVGVPVAHGYVDRQRSSRHDHRQERVELRSICGE